ncbi:MAG TPA: dihydrolipoamide acetyltransferase family protein [Anaerolineales bacterium]|nr:dihydrolipoamide acetyltransferase family protein [Anaerolineales bacterium]
MAETISMPKLGFDMAEGTLVRWVKNEGENINKGDVLAEIETDKATVEVESSASGVVRKLLVEEGSVVPIGNPIAIVGSADEKIDEAPVKGAEPKAEKKTDEKSGEELKTEPSEGGKQKIEGKAEEKPAPQPRPEAAPAPSGQAAAPMQEGPIKASPLAKKIARDNKVDLARLQGTGPGGRVVRKDVEAALSSGQPSAVSRQPAPQVVPVSGKDETIQLTKLRQAIARRMVESTTSVPHFYVTHEYKMDALMAMRKQANDYLPDNEKLSVNDFIIKAVAVALREFPNLNSSYAGDKAIRHGSINIGVAVAVEGGLLTVVNRNTDQLPLRQISADVKRMVAGAREGKVRPNDIEGSTFSISNMGMYDVENFAAIINPPEAGILAVGSAREVPVVENGQVKVGWRMKATISVDHRVSDGAEAARFMQKLAEFLENPVRMLV